jgi:hypothetical protein
MVPQNWAPAGAQVPRMQVASPTQSPSAQSQFAGQAPHDTSPPQGVPTSPQY